MAVDLKNSMYLLSRERRDVLIEKCMTMLLVQLVVYLIQNCHGYISRCTDDTTARIVTFLKKDLRTRLHGLNNHM